MSDPQGRERPSSPSEGGAGALRGVRSNDRARSSGVFVEKFDADGSDQAARVTAEQGCLGGARVAGLDVNANGIAPTSPTSSVHPAAVRLARLLARVEARLLAAVNTSTE